MLLFDLSQLRKDAFTTGGMVEIKYLFLRAEIKKIVRQYR